MKIFNSSDYRKYILFIYNYIFDNNFFLLIIIVLGIGLRIMGTNPGYYITHPDEPTITESVKRISLGLNFEPQAYYYGSLLPLLYSLPTFLLLDPYLILSFVFRNYDVLLKYGPFIPKTTDIWNAFIETNHFFEYWVRYETAILSGFTVLVGYFLGKKLFNKETGLVSAFYIAINYRHVLSSHFSLADAPVALFAILSVHLSSKLLNKLSWKTYFWAGMGLGIVMSVKYFVYTVPTFLFCHFLGSWQDSHHLNIGNRILKASVNRKLMVSILVSILAFSLVNIFIFLKPEDSLFQIQYNTTKFTPSFSLYTSLDFTKIPYYPLYYFYKLAFGEILTIFLIVGVIYSFFRHFKATLILLTAILPFLYTFVVIAGTTEARFHSSIIPLILFFPAILTVDIAKGLSALTRKINLKVSMSLFIGLLAFFTGYQSLNLSILSSYYFSTSHSSDSLQEWILEAVPDDSHYIYFWGTPTPPGYKKIHSTFITVDENNYPSMEDLHINNADYVAVGSDPGNVINGLRWMNNNQIIKKVILNDSFLWEYLNDSYASLITTELAAYRIKEFTKPWPALDPSFFVIKYPKFWNTENGVSVNTYNFQGREDVYQWTVDSYSSKPYFTISSLANSGYNNSPAMLIMYGKIQDCSIPVIKITSQPFPVKPLKFYTLSGWGKRENVIEAEQNNGFLRLDFYSESKELLKSYVSKQLKPTTELQSLKAAGVAPQNSDSAQITIQLNKCIQEKYIFDQFEVTVKNGPNIDLNEYPFFNTKLKKSFIWLPHL